MPASPATLADGQHYFRMLGRDVRDYVAEHGAADAARADWRHRAGPSGVDHFIPHQANGLMLADLAERVGLAGQVRLTVREYGNTGAASVPITLDTTVHGVGVRPGQTVLLSAFGGGMAMGAAMLRWSAGLRGATSRLTRLARTPGTPQRCDPPARAGPPRREPHALGAAVDQCVRVSSAMSA